MAKTYAELSAEEVTLNTKIKEIKDYRATLVENYKKAKTELDTFKLQLQEVKKSMSLAKASEKTLVKAAKEQEKLAALLAAKQLEETGIRISGRRTASADNSAISAAAHKSADELLAGDLDDEVDPVMLKSELDIF